MKTVKRIRKRNKNKLSKRMRMSSKSMRMRSKSKHIRSKHMRSKSKRIRNKKRTRKIMVGGREITIKEIRQLNELSDKVKKLKKNIELYYSLHIPEQITKLENLTSEHSHDGKTKEEIEKEIKEYNVIHDYLEEYQDKLVEIQPDLSRGTPLYEISAEQQISNYKDKIDELKISIDELFLKNNKLKYKCSEYIRNLKKADALLNPQYESAADKNEEEDDEEEDDEDEEEKNTGETNI